MALTASPYGLKAVKMLGNRPFQGPGPNSYRIKTNYAGVIPYGAPVRMSTTNDPSSGIGNGYIVNITDGTMNNGTQNDLYVGVFVGCRYLNPLNNNQPQWDQWYPGSVNSTFIEALVVDDPDVIFQIQAHAASFDALAQIGYSYNLNVPGTPYNTGSKDSTISLDTAGGTATTKPWKVVGIDLDPNNANATNFVDVQVKINSGFSIFSRAL